jgi:hypothetical protein
MSTERRAAERVPRMFCAPPARTSCAPPARRPVKHGPVKHGPVKHGPVKNRPLEHGLPTQQVEMRTHQGAGVRT